MPVVCMSPKTSSLPPEDTNDTSIRITFIEQMLVRSQTLAFQSWSYLCRVNLSIVSISLMVLELHRSIQVGVIALLQCRLRNIFGVLDIFL